MDGGARYRSAFRKSLIQIVTPPRKLSTITPTPTVAEKAIMSAVTATPVRLRWRTTSRLAIRASKPSRWAKGWFNRTRPTTAGGVNNAQPISSRNSPMKPEIRS